MSGEPQSEEEVEETHVIPGGAVDPIGTIFDRFIAHYAPFGFQTRDEKLSYHPLPYKPEPNDDLLLPEPWRLILELYSDEQRKMMGIDLYGDIILGRGESHPGRIILNLERYGARDLGVSREHALLRPTKTRLFVIDQGSTNGTMINGAPSGRGIATAIKDQDLIALGQLVLMVHIVSKPGQS